MVAASSARSTKTYVPTESTCVCSLSLMSFPQVAVDQVQKRKQEDPDDVDEVPVEAGDVDGSVVIGGKATLAGLRDQHHQNARPDHHVKRVQPGHGEVEREEELRVALLGWRDSFEMERGLPGNVVLFELLVPL